MQRVRILFFQFSRRSDKMKRRISIFVCALAVLQLAFGFPSTLPKNPSKEDSTSEYNAIPQASNSDVLLPPSTTNPQLPEETADMALKREKLFTMIREGTRKHMNFLLQGTNRIAKELIEDSNIVNDYTENMREEKAIIERFIKDSDEALNPTFMKCKKRVLKEFFTFANRYTVAGENHTSEDNIITKALQAHGYEQFLEDEDKLLNDIGNHYADEFENYLNSLTGAQRESEKDLVYVYETYRENPEMDRSHYGYRFRNFLLQ